MTNQKLPLSALALFNSVHLLENSVLLFGSYDKKAAILGFSPTDTYYSNNLDALEKLGKTQNPATSHTQLTFISGWAGAIAYTAGKQHLIDQSTKTGQSTHPARLQFHYYPFTVHLDFQHDEVWLKSHNPLSSKYIDEVVQTLNAISPDNTEPQVEPWAPVWSFEQYQRAFDRVQHYLHEGDAYQINLTMPFVCKRDLTQKSPSALFTQFNAPFSVYFKGKDHEQNDMCLFSVSPERFLSIHGDRIETKPIKGTLPRGTTDKEDQANYEALKHSAKNRSENLMIVDLLRNDLSRSAQAGSVRVEKLFDIESFANVHHMVSTISAQKSDTLSCANTVELAFPGGSITGAPKKRAMEIIEELEHTDREFYCGSFGYFDDSGNADFNILIRTITATKQGAQCWAGGGVISESTAQDEFNEAHHKIDALLKAKW